MTQFKKRQAGQSVIIAIAVLFILAFIAAVFISILARNLDRTSRESDTQTADFYAQAGLRYVDEMLTTSPQGADWRPPLQYQLGATVCTVTFTAANNPAYVLTGGSGELAPEEANAYVGFLNKYYTDTGKAFPKVDNNDPDSFWLNQGFSRFNTRGGRFLVRVPYGSAKLGSPFDSDSGAVGKYLKIESIGRIGLVDPNGVHDPTTYTVQPIRLHAELVAYKPIGLVDYARFITNAGQRPDKSDLGVPSKFRPADASPTTLDGDYSRVVSPGVYEFGAPPAVPTGLGQVSASNTSTTTDYMQMPLITVYGNPASGAGGSLRCNGDLRLFGLNMAFLDSTRGDDWEIAGNLTLDSYTGPAASASADINPSRLSVFGTDLAGNAQSGTLATPSNIGEFGSGTGYNFDTVAGLIRDGGTTSDANGYPRSIQRLNPPSLDTADPATNLSRYQQLTEVGTVAETTSPTHVDGPYKPLSPGSATSFESPATVYIDNVADVQPESSNVINGAYTLRDDWLNRTTTNWEGPFYNPPGANVVFGYIPVTVGSTTYSYWGFTITRSDAPVGVTAGSSAAGAPVAWQWTDPATGKTTANPLTSSTATFVYGVAPTGYTISTLPQPANPVFFLGADNPRPASGGTTYDYSGVGATNAASAGNDIVIYAEGNVRVHGVISPTSAGTGLTNLQYANTDHHVTIVTKQIAYIDGSLLKGGPGYSPTPTGGAARTVGQSDSSCAILAARYVCVNTTQFTAGSVQRSDLGPGQADQLANGSASANTSAISFEDNVLTENFDYTPVEDATPSANHAVGASITTTPNLFLSNWSGNAGSSYGQISFEDDVDGVTLAGAGTGQIDGYLLANPLTPVVGTPNQPNYALTGSSGTPNQSILDPAMAGGLSNAFSGSFDHLSLTFGKGAQSVNPYELERAAVLPSDVRIEAVLYAQNNSFFVIPGPWFNSNPKDTIDQYYGNQGRNRPEPNPNPNDATSPTPPATPVQNQGTTDYNFPLYGQPIDMKITIDGCVTENLPANISDQSAMMQKWGWIPRFHGAANTAGEPVNQSPHPDLYSLLNAKYASSRQGALDALGVPHTGVLNLQTILPLVGMTLEYDNTAGSGVGAGSYIRLDQFGRPLPFTPSLPVSPDTLYSGQTAGTSLIQ